MPRVFNDLNVLYKSPLLYDVIQGRALQVRYYQDGIYPNWNTIVQSFSNPQGRQHQLFSRMQEVYRKDVERAFRILHAVHTALDGIFGFSQGPLSVISQFLSQGLTPKVLSHCLKGDDNEGGILVLGEILEPSIVYSPLVPPWEWEKEIKTRHHYYLNLHSIAVNGKILPNDPATFTLHDGGTIIDLGTTLAYLVEEAHVPFVRAITSAISPFVTPFISYGNQCYHVTISLAEVFPIVSLNFAASASMVLKQEEYLTCSWCTIQWLSEHFAIIFYLVLKDKIIVYDLARQRIGWANYDCSSPVNRPRQWVGLGQTGL
ncbi:unnamed protein product [Prunus armeniaca]|uniref:Peptidase A1 domain-containing protein n=1 Tax=Prunus armeniaca TaxID=36596 RepID=A0A6J5XVE1_PRUAR|nr:unnamed protein product [Prunus armeniaca]